MASKYFILSRVDRPVESEVDKEICDSDEIRVGSLRLRRVVFSLLTVITEVHEDGNARRYHKYDKVLVWGEATAVEEDVHDHHWDEFTRFAEDHGRVGYV